MRFFFHFILCALMVCATTAAFAQSADRFIPQKCWFRNLQSAKTLCGMMETAEDYGRPGAKTIQFPVVRIGAGQADGARAIVLGGGGPGNAVGIDRGYEIAHWNQWRKLVLGEDRELIMMDPRGVGRSEPSLKCPALLTEGKESLIKNLTIKDELQIYRGIISRCRKRFADDGINLSAYTTAAGARDVEELRLALGIEKWDLIGFSYGSRLAFEILHRYPHSARSALMDAPLPPDAKDDNLPKELNIVINRIAESCAADSYCARYRPLQKNIADALQSVENNPLLYKLRDIDGGNSPVVFNKHRFALMLAFALYDPELIAQLPRMLNEFNKDNSRASPRLAAFAENYYNFLFNEKWSDGVNLSISCRERILSQDNSDKEETPLGFVFADAKNDFEKICREIWRVGIDNAPKLPSTSDKPILMLAGVFDFATPIAWARKAAIHLPKAQVIAVNAAHTTLFDSPCAAGIAREFLRDPDSPIAMSEDICLKKEKPLSYH